MTVEFSDFLSELKPTALDIVNALYRQVVLSLAPSPSDITANTMLNSLTIEKLMALQTIVSVIVYLHERT